MYNEPEAMREIHEIREKMYEEMKDMSQKEKLDYIHKASEEAKKKYGLRFKKAQHVR